MSKDYESEGRQRRQAAEALTLDELVADILATAPPPSESLKADIAALLAAAEPYSESDSAASA